MSLRFSLATWLLRLPTAASCIDGGDNNGVTRYYALAEDGAGQHLPYPQLPASCRALFDARLRVGYTLDHSMNRLKRWLLEPQPRKRLVYNNGKMTRLAHALNWIYARVAVRYRGETWGFRCCGCTRQSFFSLKGKTCFECGAFNCWNYHMPRPVVRFSLLEFVWKVERTAAEMTRRRWAACRVCGKAHQVLAGEMVHTEQGFECWRCFNERPGSEDIPLGWELDEWELDREADRVTERKATA